ncbi:hypothetical protein Sfulv_00590 [Streptomyces fulvorobeus]|uniref:Uncharacterized protein n=1 Tax=Streptomyces fulvorobeus TaxID=284028 RepID=A0A7J0BYD5_9ACTN|nr:hypothetical protein Sfulv_00590 [Streptomyces fulvorobeus]
MGQKLGPRGTKVAGLASPAIPISPGVLRGTRVDRCSGVAVQGSVDHGLGLDASDSGLRTVTITVRGLDLSASISNHGTVTLTG